MDADVYFNVEMKVRLHLCELSVGAAQVSRSREAANSTHCRLSPSSILSETQRVASSLLLGLNTIILY